MTTPVDLVHPAEGRLDEAVLIDAGEGGQVGDQADVGAFRRLDGAHAAVVAVVHVAHLEPGAVTGQAAGAQGGQAALMGQLGQGVVLIHELGQGRGAEKLLDGGHHRADVDQRLGSHDVHILGLQGHALPDDPLHAGEADAELVLQQLAHRTDAAVAQVVDVVGGADVMAQAVDIVDGGQHIVDDDMLGDRGRHARARMASFISSSVSQASRISAQHGIAHLLVDAKLRSRRNPRIC